MSPPISPRRIRTTAPAKAILFGEHAVNRGQRAIASSIGIEAECRLEETGGDRFRVTGLGRTSEHTRDALLRLVGAVDDRVRAKDYAGVGAIQQQDNLASLGYILGSALQRFPQLPAVSLEMISRVPVSCGLGSGAAAHVSAALAVAACALPGSRGEAIAALAGEWAYAGDRLTHGGAASALDTQTSLLGGVIEYRDGQRGTPLAVPPGLRLVIGHTGIPKGSTGSVNTRVRQWLEGKPVGVHYFHEMGLLARYGKEALERGRWHDVGALMNLNHLLLRRIGATHPDLERLCLAALEGGAFGAKLTGAGGGGCMVALVDANVEPAVVAAIAAAGGMPLQFPLAVEGARIVEAPGPDDPA